MDWLLVVALSVFLFVLGYVTGYRHCHEFMTGKRG